MNRCFKFIILHFYILIFTSCSFVNTGGVWTDKSEEFEVKKTNPSTQIFSEKEIFRKQVSNKMNLVLPSSLTNNSWKEENIFYSNNTPHFTYENKKNLILKSKKIGKNKFKLFNLNFEPLFVNGNIFFYDTSGSIYKYSINDRKLIWKFNFYKKKYKRIPIQMNLKIISDNLTAVDNLGYAYQLNIKTGQIIWAKNYGIPFRSNIKASDGNIFLVSQDNKFVSISESSGEKLGDLLTKTSFLKTDKKNNISLNKNKKNLYFINSSGELYSINFERNNINWIFNSNISSKKDSDLFFAAPLVYKDDELIVSTSISTYSLDASTGFLNWELPFSTSVRPVLTQNYIFLVSQDGFVLNLDRKNGKVIWSKNIFKNENMVRADKTGSIVSMFIASDQIFITTSKGYFVFVDYNNGEILEYTKVSKGFFSKPIIANNQIYIIDRDMRVLGFN